MSTRAANSVTKINKGGQPTKYRPEFCAEVKTFMALGYSISAFAGHVEVSRETVYEWARTIPEFADALEVARGKRVQTLEEGLLRVDQSGPAVTARIFALKNAAPHEWRDRVEHTGADGGPIRSVQLTADLTRLDEDQRDMLRQLLLTASGKDEEPA